MERISKIKHIDENTMLLAREHWNNIGKPLHGLGLFEDMIIKIAGITGNPDVRIDKRCVVVMCADNGVVMEGVTQSSSNVTSVVAEAIANGTSSINCLANAYNADVFAVDTGMNSRISKKEIYNYKISNGTNNIAVGAAMTHEQAISAVCAGIDIAGKCAENGYGIIVTGEMGIGNTTTSAAIASVLLDTEPKNVTGRGAGLDSKRLEHKINVIERAIAVNKPNPDDAIDIIAKLGGYDIAAMTGLFLGGGIYRVPIVIDGFISAVSAALAVKINPLAREYMLCSHVSKEPAALNILRYIRLRPVINAELCLGEGTGGIMLLPLLDGALNVYYNAHKFKDIKIEKYRNLSEQGMHMDFRA